MMCQIPLLAWANGLSCPLPYPPLTYHYEGHLSAYAPGVMAQVLANRQDGLAYPYLPDPLPEVDGYAAVMHCEHVGRQAVLRRGDEAWTVLVSDCAHPDSLPWMLGGPFAAEVNAALWEVMGPGWVEVEVLP